MMTLRELRAWHEDKYNTKFLSREDYQVHFDAMELIDAHLSQPQPVAHGQPCKLCFGRGERTADGSNGRRVRCNTCDGTGKISQPVAQAEAVALDAPALVGNTQFGIGVPWASVIRCAQRRYLHKDYTALTQEQIAEFRDALIPPTIPTGHRVVPVEPTDRSKTVDGGGV